MGNCDAGLVDVKHFIARRASAKFSLNPNDVPLHSELERWRPHSWLGWHENPSVSVRSCKPTKYGGAAVGVEQRPVLARRTSKNLATVEL